METGTSDKYLGDVSELLDDLKDQKEDIQQGSVWRVLEAG